MTSRRGFLLGLGAVLAAPAIVRIDNIMPVRNRLVTYASHGFENGDWWYVPNEADRAALGFSAKHWREYYVIVHPDVSAELAKWPEFAHRLAT